MIENHFIVLDCDLSDPDMPTGKMRCKDCEELFDVEMFILAPKNCRHDLGESITVICPKCKIEATTTLKENRITFLKKLRDNVDRKIQKALDEIKTVPKVFEFGTDLDKLSAKGQLDVKCLTCEHEFEADPIKQTNAMYLKEKLTIICPECTELMVFDRTHFKKCIGIVNDSITLVAIEDLLVKLTGEPECRA